MFDGLSMMTLLLQDSFTLTKVSHASRVGLWTCLLQKNVLMHSIMSRLSIARQTIRVSTLGVAILRDVLYLIRVPCISIRIPPEQGGPTPLAFAIKVIRNFECIIQLYENNCY